MDKKIRPNRTASAHDAGKHGKALEVLLGALGSRRIVRTACLLLAVQLVLPAATLIGGQAGQPTGWSRSDGQSAASASNGRILLDDGYFDEAVDDELSLDDMLSRSGSVLTESDETSLTEPSLPAAEAGATVESGLAGQDAGSVDPASAIVTPAPAETTLPSEQPPVVIENKTVRVIEAIPFTTVTVDDPNLYVGETRVRTEGVAGQRAIIYEDRYANGVFVVRTKTGTEIIRKPVQKVIARGTKKRVTIAPYNPRTVNQAAAGTFNKIKDTLLRNGSISYRSFSVSGTTLTVDGRKYTINDRGSRTITVYDGLQVCQNWGDHKPAINHKTASGIPAQRGLVATFAYRSDGKVTGTALPFGTLVFVEGYGLGVVADIHGAKTNTGMLDVCYDPGELAGGKVAVGKWSRTVYVLKTP